jgi:mRNA interferase RelE/StbE
MGAVTYTRKAIKGLRKMPRHHADNIRSALERIAVGDSQGLDIKALQGKEGHRLRSGGYRAIYEIDGEQINVLVLDAGPRGDIYK